MARILFFVAMLARDTQRSPIVWLVLRWGSRAEKTQQARPHTPSRPSAPDDDPEFLFRLERDIQRKRREEERRKRERGEDASDGDATGADS